MDTRLALILALGLSGCGDGGSSSTPVASAPSQTVSSTGMPTTTRTMGFASCLQVLRETAEELGVAPVNIAETSQLRIVRFNTTEGSVLLTCSAPDRKLIIVESPHGG